MQTENVFNRNKGRHFVHCVQICFFHVSPMEIGKILKAGAIISTCDGQQGATLGIRFNSTVEPRAQLPLVCHELEEFSDLIRSLQDEELNSLIR